MSETANIRISSAVHAKARIAAAIRGVTIKELVEDAITEKLARDGALERGHSLADERPRNHGGRYQLTPADLADEAARRHFELEAGWKREIAMQRELEAARADGQLTEGQLEAGYDLLAEVPHG